LKVLFAASECNPFVKTGGLADVIGALPKALADLKSPGEKIEAAVVLPKYSLIDAAKFPLRALPGRFLVPVGEQVEETVVWTLGQSRAEDLGFAKVSVYFIENRKYFNRPGIYQTPEKDFPDNDERFIFFSRAVLELCKFLDFRPDVVHCHDWQTGLIPAYLKTLYRMDAFFNRTASVFTIHNIAYQGIFPKQSLFQAGFSWHDFTPEKLEYYDQLCFLKAGLVYADKVSTVSPTYCAEVQKEGGQGKGMEGILQSRAEDFSGILNGLDYSEWDPSKDELIPKKYSPKVRDWIERKKANKRTLQEFCQLPQAEVPLVGMVSRLDPQKGFNRVVELIPQLLGAGTRMQWVILGSGDKRIRESLASIAKRYPREVSVHFAFDDQLAHRIYSGSDFFFMPSEFEPCGLSQMIAMKYGTPPIVTPTGGLMDTVAPWSAASRSGTGFVSKEISTEALAQSVQEALDAYSSGTPWVVLRENAMAQDFSWKVSAQKYLELFRKASGERSAA
jgi:starch synthase